jgi:hypothetical protein
MRQHPLDGDIFGEALYALGNTGENLGHAAGIQLAGDLVFSELGCQAVGPFVDSPREQVILPTMNGFPKGVNILPVLFSAVTAPFFGPICRECECANRQKFAPKGLMQQSEWGDIFCG